MPHLLVDISAHGYGHISQTAPVVNALAARIPDLRVTVRSAAPAELLKRRFLCEFSHIPVAPDFGMRMANAVDVQAEESAAAYHALHADWDGQVKRAAQEIRALQPDLLLANVPYLSLAAAQVAGVRAAAMCSLNWADIYRHYCVHDAEGAAIHAQMLAAYNSAEVFLKLRPAMDMADLKNARSIAPVAQVGLRQRARIDVCLPLWKVRMGVEQSGSQASTPSPALPLQGGGGVTLGRFPELKVDVANPKLILVAMGGIEFRLPMEHWPRIEGVCWLVPQAWNIARDDMIALESPGLPFGDLLASCDAVLTKPGYGTFVEAACAGVPVLYVSRGDWPEEPCLVQWLEQYAVCRIVERERLQSGDLAEVLRDLWAQPKPPAPVASGAEEAAEILERML
jgi:hypothetical protein